MERAIGKNGIPLIYVIRDNTTNSFNGSYESRIDWLVHCVKHVGPNYKFDNSDVFSFLIQYTENTEGHSLITLYTHRRDGLAIWTAISNSFEGATFREKQSQEVMKMLK